MRTNWFSLTTHFLHYKRTLSVAVKSVLKVFGSLMSFLNLPLYGRSSAVASAGAKLRIEVCLGTKEDVFLVTNKIRHQNLDFLIEWARIVELVIALCCRAYWVSYGSLNK